MANLFNSVKIKNPKRNKFNLSHSKRLTTEFGRLTPILCEPVLPADKFTIKTTLKVRFAPMTLPVMERFKAYLHYWYVPNRIIWDNWETFITGGEDGVSDLDHTYPFITIGREHSGISNTNVGLSSLFDYLGFPAHNLNVSEEAQLANNPKEFDALPFKAYQKIYDEFYRDQNLESAMDLHTDLDGDQIISGSSSATAAYVNGLMSIRYRAWRKDYFTSALPDPQRGPDVTLPLFGDLEITGEGTSPLNVTGVQDPDNPSTLYGLKTTDGGDIYTPDVPGFNLNPAVLGGTVNNGTIAQGLAGDSSGIRSASINDVRRGFALQRLYELAARVGGRYAENIFGNFGVHAGDARLQRPEYLGGSVVPIYVGDVLQTSATEEEGTPLGMPAGVAGALGECKQFSKTFYEHGWIIGILSIVPDAAYIQGIPRKFLKRDRLDFAWPLLANLGEQEIQNQELYFDWVAQTDDDNKAGFGYTPRYAEYKFGMNGVHGDFRGSLNKFHDARIFSSAPALNKEFITVKPTGGNVGLNRIFAVTDENYDHLWVHLYNDVLVRRKLPKYGTPI